MILRWFLSKTARQATAMRKHVWRLLMAQRDILSPQAIEALTSATRNLQNALGAKTGKSALQKEMENLEKAANKWLKPYPHAAWRENVEVLLVALAVAMGIRTFFLQPFKIPTGSMQPTLYGVTSENLIHRQDFKIPTGLARLREWLQGASYIHVVAKTDGNLERIETPLRLLIFNVRQRLLLGGIWHTVWFPPDYGSGSLDARAGVYPGQQFRKGQDVIRLRVTCGDHLFVDRLTYNFRRPHRAEIIVFETKGINHPSVPQDQFYIKRLVALGGERVRVGKDHHLIINGTRLDAATPGFENVYTFREDAGENEYFGHTQVEKFYDEDQEVQLRPNHLMVMGDNTRNSLDSRFFGDFSQEFVIGKSWFVYWPITKRFGCGYR
jgi:signal peptidase I